MKLEVKKSLAARALKVGKNRIIFNLERLSEIKEAITKQDMKDLYQDKAIFIKEIKGRKKVRQRNNRRRAGSIKGNSKSSKSEYVILTRKLRSYIAYLRKTNQLSREEYLNYRKEIRARIFRSLSQLKEIIQERASTIPSQTSKGKKHSFRSKTKTKTKPKKSERGKK